MHLSNLSIHSVCEVTQSLHMRGWQDSPGTLSYKNTALVLNCMLTCSLMSCCSLHSSTSFFSSSSTALALQPAGATMAM